MNLISRNDAISSGKKRYFTGFPCKHGHVAERKTSNHECYECSLIRNRQWFKENPDKDSEKKKRRYLKHKEKIIATSILYYEKNRDAVLIRVAKYQKNNPHIGVAASNRRRIAANKSIENFTSKDVTRILDLQKHKCAICKIKVGAKTKYHVDHIFPISKSFDNSRHNIQILCAKCNQKKSSRDPIDYAQKLGMLI